MQLNENIKKQIIDIVKNYDDIEKVYLFGSRARGDAESRSDIDLAIEGGKLEEDDWYNIYFTLQEELETLLSIDVVWINESSNDLKQNIIREGCVLYDNSETKTKYG